MLQQLHYNSKDSKYIAINGHPELVKDTNSGAILNIDNQALEAYRNKKKQKQLEEKRINNLENDMIEIKYMMKQLLKEIQK